jgi:hypothetical protein
MRLCPNAVMWSSRDLRKDSLTFPSPVLENWHATFLRTDSTRGSRVFIGARVFS